MKAVCFIDSVTGNLAVMYPQYNDKLRFINHPNETDDECLARAIATSIPDGVEYHIIDTDTDLPPNRDFRNAWEWED